MNQKTIRNINRKLKHLLFIPLLLATFAFGDTLYPSAPVTQSPALTGGTRNDPAWFSDDLETCCFLVRPNIRDLKGRALIFTHLSDINRYGYERTRHYMRQLKEMGITDVMQLVMQGCAVTHPTENKQAWPLTYGRAFTVSEGYDPLMTLVQAAAKEGINITIKMQAKKVQPNMQAKNSKGEPYDDGKIPDYLNRDYRQFLHEMIDEYTGKYNVHKNIKGFYIDMPWDNMKDCFGDDFSVFEQFCLKNFNETPPREILEKIETGRTWMAPEDKWWRRFFLFRQWVGEDFLGDISGYCHKKGIEFGLQVGAWAGQQNSWAFGHDPYKASRLADWVLSPAGESPCCLLDNGTPGMWCHSSLGRMNAYAFRGKKMGVHFLFNSLCDPYMPTFTGGGNTPQITRQWQNFIINQKEWTGAGSLVKAGLLHNETCLMLAAGPRHVSENEKEIQTIRMLSFHQPVDRFFINDIEKYDDYRVLIAPKYSVRGISAEVFSRLKQFVEKGGTLISLDADWSTSKADLTDENDVTAIICGVKKESGKIIPVGDVQPLPLTDDTNGLVATEFSLGKGKVINFSFEVMEKINAGDQKLRDFFASLVQKYSAPEISIESDNATGFRAISALKKNNWIGVSLYSDDKTPAKGIVRFDMEKTGVKAGGYRILLLGRGMELLKSREHRCYSFVSLPDKENCWTSEDLKKGIPITITENNEANLPLPDRIDPKIRQDWEKEKKAAQRHYEYEIVVVSPYDELTIDGEKCD